MTLTHDQLVAIAARYAATELACGPVVVTEGGGRRGESPDVFGVSSVTGYTVVIEAKVSMADFRADLVKPWRDRAGCGQQRWYIAEAGVIERTKIPAPWGLLVTDGDSVIEDLAAAAPFHPSAVNRSQELNILADHIRKMPRPETGKPGRRGGIQSREPGDGAIDEIVRYVLDVGESNVGDAAKACGLRGWEISAATRVIEKAIRAGRENRVRLVPSPRTRIAPN